MTDYRFRELLRATCAALVLIVLSACATAPGPTGRVANVAVVDSPNAVDRLYRYISWNGTRYSAQAFVFAAQRARMDSILLSELHAAGERCVAALAGALKVPAYTVAASGGGAARLRSRDTPVQAACDIGDGDLRVGEDYFRHRIARDGARVLLDDGAPVPPEDAVTRLRELRARSLVALRGTAADLLCFDAIAREAEVPLYETGDDGQLREAGVRAGATVAQACTP